MKKALLLCVFFVINALCADHTGRLPQTITLTGGQNQIDNAIADCSSIWECIFNADKNSNAYSFTYNTTGTTNSTLTLNATLPQNPQSQKQSIPFYVSTLTINKYSNLVLNGFESLSVRNAVNINGGSLSYSHTTPTSGFGLPYSASVSLSNNARFDIKAGIFTNQGQITLNNQSTLNIDTEGGNKTNNYGSITNNNSEITVQKDLWNLGQKPALGAASPSSIATITNNGGTIRVLGNLYNGGQNFSNGAQFCQIGFCGGGNLIINGGSVNVGGQLVSEGKDGQASTIQIYGGTLTVTGGLQNKQDSTLIFGIGSNNQMGLLQGNLTNDKGVVEVDVRNITLGQDYQIIAGTANIDKTNIVINSSNAKFYDVNYQNGTITINLASSGGGGSGGGGATPPTPTPTPAPSLLEEYKNSLSPNERTIFNALSLKYGGDDKILQNVDAMESSISNFDNTLKESYISQPQSIISAFKNDSLLVPLNQSFVISKPLAAMELMRIDTGKQINPFEYVPHSTFFANSFGGVLRADNLKGYLAGFTLGSSYANDDILAQIYFSYAYGTSSQDLDTQSTDTKGNLLQVGAFGRHYYKLLESDLNVNFVFGNFNIDNKWLQNNALNSSASFNNYQGNLGLIIGPRFGEKASIKPFLGVQNYVEAQDNFKQKGGLSLESKAYDSYILDAVGGVETRYMFEESAFAFAKLSYENKLYNSHKEFFMRLANEELKYENKSYKNALSVNLGIEIFALNQTRINAELLYKHYDTGLDYYGGNLLLKYNF